MYLKMKKAGQSFAHGQLFSPNVDQVGPA